jgi:prepilin-type N-terminal cleavage/methylation domain-containing protein
MSYTANIQFNYRGHSEMNLKTSKGFTIVELLIVIVVIAILAAISIVAYTGIQDRARNSAGLELANQVAGKIRSYNAIAGSWPTGYATTGNKALTPATTPPNTESDLGTATISSQTTAPVNTAGSLSPAAGTGFRNGTEVIIVFGTATTPPVVHYRTGANTTATITF